MFLVASLCSCSFSFMMEVLPAFVLDVTEACSDLDQLSTGCLKVEEKLLSATSLTSVSSAVQESTRWTLG